MRMENSDNSEEMEKDDMIVDNNENGNEMETETSATAQEGTDDATEVDELKKAQGEVAESKDKYLRLYSEFENFRRRTSKEKLEMIQSANEQLLKALLPVADDFERAENAISDTENKDIEGFLLIRNKFKKILDQYGVKTMEISMGDAFNADTQEAITQIPAPEEKLKGKIIDVVEKGYLLNEKVIRYAKVVLGN